MLTTSTSLPVASALPSALPLEQLIGAVTADAAVVLAQALHEFQTDGLSSRTRAYGGDRIAQLLSGVCSRAENELSRTAHQRFDRTPAPRCSHLVQK